MDSPDPIGSSHFRSDYGTVIISLTFNKASGLLVDILGQMFFHHCKIEVGGEKLHRRCVGFQIENISPDQKVS